MFVKIIRVHTLRHLIKAKEAFGIRLTSYHNLYFLIKLMEDVREAIMEDRLLALP